jgi:hypothetical protein
MKRPKASTIVLIATGAAGLVLGGILWATAPRDAAPYADRYGFACPLLSGAAADRSAGTAADADDPPAGDRAAGTALGGYRFGPMGYRRVLPGRGPMGRHGGSLWPLAFLAGAGIGSLALRAKGKPETGKGEE